MQKKNLVTGIFFICIGIMLLTKAILSPQLQHVSLLFGFAGGMIGPGISSVCRYIYWTRPSRAAEYQKKLHEQAIQLKDERNIKIHEKSGRYTFLLTLLIHLVILLVLSMLKIFSAADVPQYVIIMFSCLLLFQIIIYRIIYRREQKKL